MNSMAFEVSTYQKRVRSSSFNLMHLHHHLAARDKIVLAKQTFQRNKNLFLLDFGTFCNVKESLRQHPRCAIGNSLL